MISTTQNLYNQLIEHCFSFMSKPLNKWRKKFITDVLWLFLSIKGHINFSSLGRYSSYGEQRFRQQFENDFNFLEFNSALVNRHCSCDKVIAFDPCFIPKSGKKTPGLGKFWSGCASSIKQGLEICGIAAIDLENHTAMHLTAVQTMPDKMTKQLEYYASMLVDRKEELLKISSTVVADAFFSKKPFVDILDENGLQLISRFRDDVRLSYLIKSVKTGKKGRPKTIGKKVNLEQIDENYFTKEKSADDNTRIYSASVRAVALKRNVKVVVVFYQTKKNTKAYNVYFSTNTELTALDILDCYQSRFQIEFLYRDAKQNTGLNNCQARDENKLNNHFNLSLTAINIAKVVHWFSIDKDLRKAFSIKDVKTMNHNALLLNRFFTMFGIKPNILKNNHKIKELLLYGTIAS